MKYAIVDDITKVVVNIVLWNGVTPWNPPDGTTAFKIDDVLCYIGWIQQEDGSFAPPSEEI